MIFKYAIALSKNNTNGTALGKKSDRGPDFGDKMNNTRQYADFRACSKFRTETPLISTISQRRQVTTTVPDAAKRCRFYRVELLNGGEHRTRGEREEKKGKRRRKKRKARKALITSEKKEKEKRKHEKKQKETSKGKKMKVKETCCKYVILSCLLFYVAKNSIKSY